MGRNLLVNIVEQGFVGVGYDPDPRQRDMAKGSTGDSAIDIVPTIAEFVSSLERPRRILLLVPASQVGSVLRDLSGLLENDDVVVDCGNSYFIDTEERFAAMRNQGIRFMGAGVSGGEKGARTGASIMVGGDVNDYGRIAELLVGASAKVGSDSCCALVGNHGAGHFVKMVHNGIEYALMQSISESYQLLRSTSKLSNSEVAEIFDGWNDGVLGSFLMEISAGILRKTDPETGRDLIDLVSDVAGQKGTGMWTSRTAMEHGVPIPTIDAAVSMRQISSMKDVRSDLQVRIPRQPYGAVGQVSVSDVESMLIVNFLASFAQGFSLIEKVSAERGFGIEPEKVAAIWRGGCIVRAKILSDITVALAQKRSHLFQSDVFSSTLVTNLPGARRVVVRAVTQQIPLLSSTATLAYLDALTSDTLSTNLIQAQRDCFGAHTYRRVDREGDFHTEDWID